VRFDPAQLETLVAVVDEGGFDAAARRLSVTPSAVSQRIKALERATGRVLVARERPARPTASGEALLRLARQTALLERDAAAALGLPETGPLTVPLAVNADSMGSWLLPALAAAARRVDVVVDLRREDQDRTAGLLASGEVMAAVTSRADPVAGCAVAPLGRMRYRPAAHRDFAARWFPDGPTPAALAVAPVVEFDRADDLQRRYLRSRSRRELDPPRNYVPASADFARAIALGLGWGLMLDHQLAEHPDVVVLDPARTVDVPLHWQQWDLRSEALDAVADEVVTAARAALV